MGPDGLVLVTLTNQGWLCLILPASAGHELGRDHPCSRAYAP